MNGLEPMVQLVMKLDILFNKPQMVDILSLELIIMLMVIHLVIKTDSDGYEEWTQTYGGNVMILDILFNKPQMVDILLKGKWYLNSDLWLIKTDSEGQEEWTQTYGGGGDETGHSVQQTSDGGYIVSGTNDNYDLWLIKTDCRDKKNGLKNMVEMIMIMDILFNKPQIGGYIVTGTNYSWEK